MKTFISIFFSISTIWAFGQIEEDLVTDHHTGTYQYTQDTGYGNFRIKRTKRKQIEYSLDKKKKLVFKVRWVSDSEYWLEFVRAKDDAGCLKTGDILKVRITKWDETGYSCFSTNDRCGNVTVSFEKL